jgi:hypothetical protein
MRSRSSAALTLPAHDLAGENAGAVVGVASPITALAARVPRRQLLVPA